MPRVVNSTKAEFTQEQYLETQIINIYIHIYIYIYTMRRFLGHLEHNDCQTNTITTTYNILCTLILEDNSQNRTLK